MFRSAIEGFEIPDSIMDPSSRTALRLSGEAVFIALRIPRVSFVRAMRLPTAVWMDLLLAIRHGVAICGWSQDQREVEIDEALFWHPRVRRQAAPYGSGRERRVLRRVPPAAPPTPP